MGDLAIRYLACAIGVAVPEVLLRRALAAGTRGCADPRCRAGNFGPLGLLDAHIAEIGHARRALRGRLDVLRTCRRGDRHLRQRRRLLRGRDACPAATRESGEGGGGSVTARILPSHPARSRSTRAFFRLIPLLYAVGNLVRSRRSDRSFLTLVPRSQST